MMDDLAELTLNAALDGELDAAETIRFAQARANDPSLAQRHASLLALRGALRAHGRTQQAPDALRIKITALASQDESARFRTPRPALAAALALAFLGGGISASLLPTRSSSDERLAMMLVDDHRRALLASTPTDIESSDRHTIKPWFDARLALSPAVVDLSAQGYVLVGGRADVVEGTPAPTLVYRLRDHLISVTALPSRRFPRGADPAAIEGYETLSWSDGAFVYRAIADLPRSELEAFAAAFRAAAIAGQAR